MAAVPVTTNVVLQPGAGWTLLSSNPTGAFLRINKLPAHVPVFITWAASLPTSNTGGYRLVECDTHFEGAITGNLYGRLKNNTNDEVTISVFSL